MNPALASSIIVVFFVVPFLWSIVVLAARTLSGGWAQPALRETTERGLLVLMIAPAFVGAGGLLLWSMLPESSPFPPVLQGISEIEALSGGDMLRQSSTSFDAAAWSVRLFTLLFAVYWIGVFISALRIAFGEWRVRRILST